MKTKSTWEEWNEREKNERPPWGLGVKRVNFPCVLKYVYTCANVVSFIIFASEIKMKRNGSS